MSSRITILGGTGPAGMGLALRWARAGESLIIGSRDATRAQAAAAKIKESAGRNVQVSGAKKRGVRAIDGGKLENARIVEQITALLIGLNIRHKGHSGIRITGLPNTAYKS